MKQMPRYYLLPLLVLLLPLSTWLSLSPAQKSKEAVLPPALPELMPEENIDLLEKMLADNLWDKERGQLASGEAESAKTVAVANCRLKGISYAQTQVPQAMFACDKKLILLHEGDELPDKGMLREIHADHVVVERAGEMRREYLFGKKGKIISGTNNTEGIKAYLGLKAKSASH